MVPHGHMGSVGMFNGGDLGGLSYVHAGSGMAISGSGRDFGLSGVAEVHSGSSHVPFAPPLS